MRQVDYYELLGVTEAAGEAEIKSAYRRLALRHHPDRNPGDAQAEERFKAISEAYAVLSDPARRTAYDLARKTGQAREFDFSQQEAFAELLRRMAQGGMGDLGPEFARSGLRFDEAFLRQVFFGQGPFVVRGFFFAGSPGAAWTRWAGPGPGPGSGAGRVMGPVVGWMLRQASKAALALAGFGLRRLEERYVRETAAKAETGSELDLTYSVDVSRQEAQQGTSLELSYLRGARRQRVAVKVPPGTQPGTMLKLRGMGKRRGAHSGDLLLEVKVR